MAGAKQPVDWMFAFKFNTACFPGCSDDGVPPPPGTKGIFGGVTDDYKSGHSQNYVFATSANPTLSRGVNCLGATLKDPLGATFAQVYNQPGYYYVVWNDQFYNNPIENHESPWGHSKGMAAWNDDGEGFVLQVSTPSWPASASRAQPRQNDGNTLGCINDDDIEVSQHFFAVKLTKDDLAAVLTALANASVATSQDQPSIFNNGGPTDIQVLAKALGKQSTSKQVITATLSSGVTLISKPSSIAVPPWQMVSAQLKSVNLRVASWWAKPEIYSTKAGEIPGCWGPGLGTPGAVEIATTGMWDGKEIGLTGGDGPNFNHAKIGISADPKNPMAIFGDMNQQGALSSGYAYAKQTCSSSQNGRGGTFYVLRDAAFFKSMTALLAGKSAPTTPAGYGSAPAAPNFEPPVKKTAVKKVPVKKVVVKKTAAKTAVKATTKKAVKKTASKSPVVKKAAKKATAKKVTAKKITRKATSK